MRPNTETITVSGGFHASPPMRIRVNVYYNGDWAMANLSRSQYTRLGQHFCGVKGCMCGAWQRAEAQRANGQIVHLCGDNLL